MHGPPRRSRKEKSGEKVRSTEERRIGLVKWTQDEKEEDFCISSYINA